MNGLGVTPPPHALLNLIRQMAQGKNGVHIRDLIQALEERGFPGWGQAALRSHLESALGIAVRLQLKVDGVNSMGIHQADVPADSARSLLRIPVQTRTDEWVGCAVFDGLGRNCPELPAIENPLPLCQFHRWEVAAGLFDQLAGAETLRRAQAMAVHDAGAAVAPVLSGPHEEVVYFLVLGNRVKIGYTGNLGKRLASLSLPRSSVAVTLAGGRPLERELHAAFAFQRESPQSEWFRLEGTLDEYLKAKVRDSATKQLTDRREADDASQPLGEEEADEPEGVSEPDTPDADDALLTKAEEVVREAGYASVTLLQRRLGIGYARAGRMIDRMEDAGLIGPSQGPRPRSILTPADESRTEQADAAELEAVASPSPGALPS